MTETKTEARQLTAEDILSASDLEIQQVNVPEWNGSIYMRVLPADEGLKLDETMQALPKEKKSDALFLLLGACLCDSKGERLFSTPEHLARLRSRSQKVLLRLQQEALVLQGWSTEATPGKNA